MTILYALITFILTIVLEILLVLDFYAAIEKKAFKAMLTSGAISLTGAIIVLFYIDNRWMIVPDILGSMVGAYISVKHYSTKPGSVEPELY